MKLVKAFYNIALHVCLYQTSSLLALFSSFIFVLLSKTCPALTYISEMNIHSCISQGIRYGGDNSLILVFFLFSNKCAVPRCNAFFVFIFMKILISTQFCGFVNDCCSCKTIHLILLPQPSNHCVKLKQRVMKTEECKISRVIHNNACISGQIIAFCYQNALFLTTNQFILNKRNYN